MAESEREQRAEPRNPKSNQERVLRSEELFGEERVVLIQHGREYYRLMITRQGKLILNK